MKDEHRKNVLFVFYILAVLILAIIYFTVPERKAFFDYQVEWWSEFWSVLKSFL